MAKAVNCSHALCPVAATRQSYSDDYDPSADHWRESNFQPWCLKHAPDVSWPLVLSHG